jgi:ABC-type sugar transport system permease subunit
LSEGWSGAASAPLRARPSDRMIAAAPPRRHAFWSYDQTSALAFLAPMLAVLLVVAVFPILYSFWISLFDLKLTRPHRAPFVWFQNYGTVLQDSLFWWSVLRSAYFSVLSVVAIMMVALACALLLNEEFRGRRALTAILLVPWAIPYVANALMWKWIYDSGYGALNGVLFQLDFIDKYMVWLGDPDKTIPLIANAFVWKEVPLATILLLVTMKSIPADLYAAAKVDGAGVFQRFWHVTLPALRPGFLLVLVYETMMAVRHFDLFFILTEGGPAEASHVLAWQVYAETFRKLSFGTGAALSYILAIVTLALAYFIIRALGRRL